MIFVSTQFIENIEIDSVNKEQNNHVYFLLDKQILLKLIHYILLKIYNEEFDPGSG